MTVIGMGQYNIPPVVLRIISVSEININLLGEPALPLATAVGHALHHTDGEGEETAERFRFFCLFATAA